MRIRTTLLLATCAGLGWLAAQGAAGDGGSWGLPAPALAGPVPVARVQVSPPPAPVRAAWEEQVARPLFAATRRPPEPPAAPALVAAPEPEPPPPAAASGVVLRPDGGLALLRLADSRVVRVQEGEEVEGWQVTRISAGGVEVARGGQSLTLPTRMAAAEGLELSGMLAGGGDERPMAASGGGGGAPPRPVAVTPSRRGARR